MTNHDETILMSVGVCGVLRKGAELRALRQVAQIRRFAITRRKSVKTRTRKLV